MPGDAGEGRDGKKPQDRRVQTLMEMEEESHHGPDHQHVREINFVAVASEPAQEPGGAVYSIGDVAEDNSAAGAYIRIETSGVIECCARLKTLLQHDEQQRHANLQGSYVETN